MSWFNVHQIMSKIRQKKKQSAVIKSWHITVHLVSDKPVNNFMSEDFHKINDSLSNGALLKLQRQRYMICHSFKQSTGQFHYSHKTS